MKIDWLNANNGIYRTISDGLIEGMNTLDRSIIKDVANLMEKNIVKNSQETRKKNIAYNEEETLS